MERTTGHHFAVPCTVGRSSYHLIVDTGAALTQIDQSLLGPPGITPGQPALVHDRPEQQHDGLTDDPDETGALAPFR